MKSMTTSNIHSMRMITPLILTIISSTIFMLNKYREFNNTIKYLMLILRMGLNDEKYEEGKKEFELFGAERG